HASETSQFRLRYDRLLSPDLTVPSPPLMEPPDTHSPHIEHASPHPFPAL
ncbi:hypothetical protein B0H34DRAFT_725082, partial [Crassisporium funariophilum]